MLGAQVRRFISRCWLLMPFSPCIDGFFFSSPPFQKLSWKEKEVLKDPSQLHGERLSIGLSTNAMTS